MAQRAFWKGYLKLSLVTCRVAMTPAVTESSKLRFHNINRKTGNRVVSRYVDAETGKPVDDEDQVKGYERAEDDYVLFEDDELEDVALESTRTIDIESFVPRSSIGWIWYDSPHYLAPADKVARVEALQAAGRRVLMVGDGINDAPVLAAADASVVMRSGSALAQTCGDLLMLDQAWGALPAAIVVARQARQRLTQNLRWAVVYNVAAAPLAAAGLVAPWLAALGMSLSSVLVVLNARRIGMGTRA